MQHLSRTDFANEFTSAFPGDDSGDLHPRQTPGALYSLATPTAVREPTLVAWSDELAAELGIARPDEDDVRLLAGSLLHPSMKPFAACYAGHQFGQWAGQLGDGRAITLGEWRAPDDVRHELQLKGAGPTAYSRRADGRAVLRSSVREYLMSEAMHGLGVPTTRALALVTTGERVLRDMFYDGNPAYEPGAIVTRVAPSFLRFGSFQMPAARSELENLRSLVDWTIVRYYPHLAQQDDRIVRMYGEIVERTARLVTHWMRVGFVHGVMNTDNMSILGLTIDYGPYSFVDAFDPNFTPNTTDLPGRRYAFGRQPAVAHWNLARFAEALAPLVEDTNELVAQLERYPTLFTDSYLAMMADKLGLDALRDGDRPLIESFETLLVSLQPDMTIFFRLLADLPWGDADADASFDAAVAHLRPALYHEPSEAERAALERTLRAYDARRRTNRCTRAESIGTMKRTSPRFVLRNYLLHSAIEGLERGDDTLFRKLEDAMREPYVDRADDFFVRRPDWANEKAGCSMLSCSS